jgi:hypothetical protein
LKRAGDRKRWPQVVSELSMPPTTSGTTLPPSTHRIECNGRTQVSEPAPQRIDFGQGNFCTTSVMTPAMIPDAVRPGFSITAT